MYKMNKLFDDLIAMMNVKYLNVQPSVIFIIVPDEKVCLDFINLIGPRIDNYPEFNNKDVDITTQIYRSDKFNALIEKSMTNKNHITIVVVSQQHKEYIDFYIIKGIKDQYPVLLASGAKRYNDNSFRCNLVITDPSGKKIEAENYIEQPDTFFTSCYRMDLPKL